MTEASLERMRPTLGGLLDLTARTCLERWAAMTKKSLRRDSARADGGTARRGAPLGESGAARGGGGGGPSHSSRFSSMIFFHRIEAMTCGGIRGLGSRAARVPSGTPAAYRVDGALPVRASAPRLLLLRTAARRTRRTANGGRRERRSRREGVGGWVGVAGVARGGSARRPHPFLRAIERGRPDDFPQDRALAAFGAVPSPGFDLSLRFLLREAETGRGTLARHLCSDH